MQNIKITYASYCLKDNEIITILTMILLNIFMKKKKPYFIKRNDLNKIYFN